jgi:hypothetical protein
MSANWRQITYDINKRMPTGHRIARRTPGTQWAGSFYELVEAEDDNKAVLRVLFPTVKRWSQVITFDLLWRERVDDRDDYGILTWEDRDSSLSGSANTADWSTGLNQLADDVVKLVLYHVAGITNGQLDYKSIDYGTDGGRLTLEHGDGDLLDVMADGFKRAADDVEHRVRASLDEEVRATWGAPYDDTLCWAGDGAVVRCSTNEAIHVDRIERPVQAGGTTVRITYTNAHDAVISCRLLHRDISRAGWPLGPGDVAYLSDIIRQLRAGNES